VCSRAVRRRPAASVPRPLSLRLPIDLDAERPAADDDRGPVRGRRPRGDPVLAVSVRVSGRRPTVPGRRPARLRVPVLRAVRLRGPRRTRRPPDGRPAVRRQRLGRRNAGQRQTVAVASE